MNMIYIDFLSNKLGSYISYCSKCSHLSIIERNKKRNMKIYSKFTDYYDHATGYYPSDIVWKRYTKMDNIKDGIFNSDYSNKTNIVLNNISKIPGSVKAGDLFVIGFCGKVYIVVSEYNNNNLIGSYIKPLKKEDFNFWGYYIYTEWMQKYSGQDLSDIFIDIKSPIFIIKNKCSGYSLSKRNNYGYSLIINPCLRDFGLQSVFNPVQAYQEIEMFLSNQMVMVDDPDIKRSNELIRDSKGFDNWSFKQHGPKKRKRKK